MDSNLFQNILDGTVNPIYCCNMKGELLAYNIALSKLLGIPFKQLQGFNMNQVIGPIELFKTFFDRLRVVKEINDFELSIETSNRKIRQCLVNAKLHEGDNIGYIVTLKDITEKKRKATLKQSQNLAKQTAKMKEKFLASISHEMRTPMNAILGMSNLALQTSLNEEQHSYISSIKHSSEILLGVVNDILQISELQNHRIKFENKDFNLKELLANLIRIMRYKANEKQLAVTLIYENNIPEIVRGDCLRLNQILYNLVGNAIKYTDTGHIKIRVINQNQNQYSIQLKFIIEDSGIGIPKDKIEAIFESFTRVRTKERVFEGTGLGLSIAKNLVQLQGGKIGVESQLGIGSKFSFDLIFEVGQIIPHLVDVKETEINFNQVFKLLLVEDHKMNQLVAKKTLEKQWPNITIKIAQDGEEAIAILQKEVFDIILMDIHMPKMNGFEATQYIRQKMPANIAAIPILAMTAHAHLAQDQKFKCYGMNDCILKPFQPQVLFKKINKYLEKI